MKIYFHTLGCAKNLVESENLAGYIFSKNKNPDFVLQPSEADFAIIHTCSFIKPAIRESIQTLRHIRRKIYSSEFSYHRTPARIILTGCLAQVYKTSPTILTARQRKIIEENADFIVGTGELEKVLNIIRAKNPDEFKKRGEKKQFVFPTGGGFHSATYRLIPSRELRPWSYLRVAEGCFHRCNYCAIPLIRGDYMSRPLIEIIEEARRLCDGGAREINLISQDTASYGRGLSPDARGRINIVRLLEELEKIRALKWIRLLYSHPSSITDELIEYISASEKTLRYLDVPLQHISDRVLNFMGRPTTKSDTLRLIERLRKKIKGIVLRTTFIVGHPGEEERDFRELKSFVEEGHFLWGGVFTYSRMKGTVSAGLKDVRGVPEKIAEERREVLIETLAASSRKFFNKNFKGQYVTSLVLSHHKDEEGDIFRLRPWFSAPEVDVELTVEPSRKTRGFSVGNMVKIRMLDYPIENPALHFSKTLD